MTRNTLLGLIALLLVVAGGWYSYANREASTSVSNANEAAIETMVMEFGTKLRMVSLLAPTAERKAAMDANYSAYVAPELLAAWYPEGAEALGRYTSNPWPESMGVVEIRNTGADTYAVEANIVEVTTAPGGAVEPAAVQPVTLAVEKRGGTWLIVEMEKGAYSQLPTRQTVVGYWECLPHKDTTGPQTMECAFGIAIDQSDGHYAVNTSLMSTYPVDFPTGTKVRVTGIVTPANQLSSIQKYDIDGIISATLIEKI